MSFISRVLLTGAAAVALLAPAAHARTSAETTERLARFDLKAFSKPQATVRAGEAITVRGRVANRKGRRAGSARVTYTLRSRPNAKRGLRLGGDNVERTKGGRSRRFSERLTVPR